MGVSDRLEKGLSCIVPSAKNLPTDTCAIASTFDVGVEGEEFTFGSVSISARNPLEWKAE
jgi:hypothetical protein